MIGFPSLLRWRALAPALLFAWLSTSPAAASDLNLPDVAATFLDNHCLNCHDTVEAKGNLDLEQLSFDLADSTSFERWVQIYDRADHGEMPPAKKPRPAPPELQAFLHQLRVPLLAAGRVTQTGPPKQLVWMG